MFHPTHFGQGDSNSEVVRQKRQQAREAARKNGKLVKRVSLDDLFANKGRFL